MKVPVFYMGKAGSSTVKHVCGAIGIDMPRCYSELPPADYSQVISLVRDPIARNVSAFFAPSVNPLTGQLHAYAGYDPRLLHEFLEVFPKKEHDRPLIWFDEIFKPAAGIDVYATPFPKQKGYKIYEGERYRALVIRTEDLGKKLAKALVEFLGLPDDVMIPVEHKARGQEEVPSIARLYTDFLEKVAMPDWYIERMYGSKYAKHFYSKAALERFTKRWAG